MPDTHEHDDALVVEQRHRDAALNACGFEDEEDLEAYGFGGSPNQVRELSEHFARFEQSIRTTDAARIAALTERLHYTQSMLETISRTNSTDFREVRECILANRATLRSAPDDQG